MAKKVNWNNMEKNIKAQQRKIKNLQAAGSYLKDRPAEGYFIDNISKKPIVIADAKSSSLRRYIKVLENYYYLVTSRADRNYILAKKVEIETELNSRDDAIIKE